MELRKITRWTNWSEWKAVMDDAYNQEQSIVLYRRALARIQAWESRDSMNMPAALVGLKELLIARLCRLEHKYQLNNAYYQAYFYQNNLALSLVRFVNFVTEPYQANIFAKPIKVIASQIGLPDWIVNLRHNATHYSLPSIELLENAHDFLYEWIREKYVDVYKEIAIEKSIQDTVRLHMTNLIRDYLVLRYKSVGSKQSKNKNEEIELLDQFMELSAQFRSEFWDVLLDDGALIPSREQMNAIGIVGDEFVDDETVKMPKQLLNVWSNVLDSLAQSQLLGTLFDKLLESYINERQRFDEETMRIKTLMCWIIELIRLNSKRTSGKFECDLRQLISKIMNQPPSRYSLSFLNELYKISANDIGVSKAQYDKLIKLVSLMLEPNVDTLTSSEIETMEGIDEPNFNLSLFETKPMMNGFKKTAIDNYWNQGRPESGDWRLVDEIDWQHENLKLGQIGNQSEQQESLELNRSQSSDDDLNESISESSEVMMNGSISKQGTSSVSNLFGSTRIESLSNLGGLKSALANNYWEFETRQ